jgi:hypothetical protein
MIERTIENLVNMRDRSNDTQFSDALDTAIEALEEAQDRLDEIENEQDETADTQERGDGFAAYDRAMQSHFGTLLGGGVE